MKRIISDFTILIKDKKKGFTNDGISEMVNISNDRTELCILDHTSNFIIKGQPLILYIPFYHAILSHFIFDTNFYHDS